MKRPLVSVIMAAFNAEKTIRKSIESVLAQTYSNIEFIICDDGSVDGTVGIIREYPLIRCLSQNNQGHAASRNNAVKLAMGEYLAFIDADDVWMPEKLEIQIPLFEKKPTIGAVYSDMRLVDEKNQVLGYNAKGKMKRGYIFNDLISGNYMCGFSSLVVRMDVFKELGGLSKHIYCPDFVFLLNLSNRYEVDFAENWLVDYLIHPNMQTNNLDLSYPELISVHNELPSVFDLTNTQKHLIYVQLRKLYFSYAVLHFRRQNFSKTALILKEARSLGLLFWKSIVLSILNLPGLRQLAYNKI